MNKPQVTERLNLAAEEVSYLQPNLIEAQLNSFQDFIEFGIREIFDEINPISDYTGDSWELQFGELEWGEENIAMRNAQKLGLSHDRPLYIYAKLINKKTGEIKKQKLFVADIPVMNSRGSFVVNGNERVVVMQIVRAEGMLFVENKVPNSQIPLFAVKLMPLRGKWFDFEVNKHGVMLIKLLDKRPKILLTTLVRALGYSSNEDIKNILKDSDTGSVSYVDATLKKDNTSTSEEALLEIYRKLKPEDSLNVENAQLFLENIFFNKRRFYLGKIGRYQLNKKLGIKDKITPADYTLKPSDLVHIVRSLIKLNNGTIKVDDIDSLANRRIRGVGELIGEKFRAGILRMEKNIRDRMSTYSTEDLVTPSLIVNTKPIIAAINQFFGSSAVSRYMDQENILSELETKRRITAGGPKGLTKERATFSVRDVHSSHYSKLCPVTTPEGPSIGIVSHMAVYARINEYGFLEAPYYRILSNVDLTATPAEVLAGTMLRENAKDAKGKLVLKKGTLLTSNNIARLTKTQITQVKVYPKVAEDVVYFTADEENQYKIGPATVIRDKENNLKNEAVFVRFQGNYMKIPSSELDYIDINPGQIAGLGLSLVPFSFNDDPTRTLMAANMQRQAVPLLMPESPIVGTGYEKIVVDASGRGIKAEKAGTVTESDAAQVTIKYDGDKKPTYFELEKYIKTNQNTCFSQRLLVRVGDRVEKDQQIIDGPSMENGELALGRSLLAAYMVYDGFNYEDAIIISERLVKEDVLTSIHIKEYSQDIRETKMGDEQKNPHIPHLP